MSLFGIVGELVSLPVRVVKDVVVPDDNERSSTAKGAERLMNEIEDLFDF